MPKQDLVGQTFGRWTAISAAPHRNRKRFWVCQCSCGKTGEVYGHALITGKAKSCGCWRVDAIGNRSRTHGESGTRIHRIWKSMRKRCINPSETAYPNYGGRGITVCDEWQDFETFASWARANGYADNLTIERIDVNGNYCPENCTWATMAEQSRNKRSNVKVEINGIQMCLSDAARAHGIEPHIVITRRKRGWPESRWFEPLRVQ